MTKARDAITVGSGGKLGGTIAIPGDKSITHRALICAALAAGESRIAGALDARDTRATAGALAALGARIDWPREGDVRVRGTAGRWSAPAAPLDLGNSGTGLRLLAGALAGGGISAVLTGDDSLRRRPMARIAQPLRAMGAVLDTAAGRPPLAIGAAGRLRGIAYRLPVASAQVKSSLLFAGLAARGDTCIEDPWGSRDHTERMLPGFGASLDVAGASITVQPGVLRAADIAVPGDASSAAFLMAAALLAPGSTLRLPNVGVNPARTGFFAVLERMGARIEREQAREVNGEPVADLQIAGAALRGVRVGAGDIPALIDELPVLMVLAACARGETVISGAGELRHKESDRIAAMEAGFAVLGAGMRVAGDRITIAGGGFARGGAIEARGDHRVAMAFALAGLAAPAPVTVAGARWIETSFPGFAQCLRAAGAGLEETP